MTTTGWLIVSLVSVSALAFAMWGALRIRFLRRNFDQSSKQLGHQIDLQLDALEHVVEHRNLLLDTLATVMMIATSHSAAIASDNERREALISISRTCGNAVEMQRRLPPSSPV